MEDSHITSPYSVHLYGTGMDRHNLILAGGAIIPGVLVS